MQKPKGTLKICSRGHRFYKSSDCPVCPQCWSGYYRTKNQSDFPPKLAAPALRALANAKLANLCALTKLTEAELAALHGIGPRAMVLLQQALKAKKLQLKK